MSNPLVRKSTLQEKVLSSFIATLDARLHRVSEEAWEKHLRKFPMLGSKSSIEAQRRELLKERL